MTIDLLPTVARLAGAELPKHPIDGKDIWPLLRGEPGAKSPHEALLLLLGPRAAGGLRAGKWKLHFPHTYRTLQEAGRDGKPGQYASKTIEFSLFDLEADPGEAKDVSGQHPDVVARIQKLADRERVELGRFGDEAGREGSPAARGRSGAEMSRPRRDNRSAA